MLGSTITDVAVLILAVSVAVVLVATVLYMGRRLQRVTAELSSAKVTLEAIQPTLEGINRAVNHDPDDTLVDRVRRIESRQGQQIDLLYAGLRLTRQVAHHVGYPVSELDDLIRKINAEET